MYEVAIFRVTTYSKEVQVDVFTSNHYGMALSVVEHIWNMRENMKHDHISVEIKLSDESRGSIISVRKWSYDVKEGKTWKEERYDAD